MADMLEDSARQLFGTHSDPDGVRRAEASGTAAALWQAIHEAGFPDALRAQTQGGAGLHPADIGGLLFQAGAHALPLPLGQTMLVRARTEVGGIATIASGRLQRTGEGASLKTVPFGRVAQVVVAELDGTWGVFTLDRAQVTPVAFNHSLSADIAWSQCPMPLVSPRGHDWRASGALVTAATMAGAMQRLLEMTVAYAGDRVQFGKPIARQQAIQQQLSVMAGQVFAARMAAQVGLSRPDSPEAVAIAKSRVNEAAAQVGPIAHAIHGAIGITADHDLQLLTRRLIEGRLAYGGEGYWQARLGQSALDSARTPLEFVQAVALDKRLPQDI